LRFIQEVFTDTGSWGDISLIVRRQTGTRERENARLKKLVADLSLEKAILKDVAEGNF